MGFPECPWMHICKNCQSSDLDKCLYSGHREDEDKPECFEKERILMKCSKCGTKMKHNRKYKWSRCPDCGHTVQRKGR